MLLSEDEFRRRLRMVLKEFEGLLKTPGIIDNAPGLTTVKLPCGCSFAMECSIAPEWTASCPHGNTVRVVHN